MTDRVDNDTALEEVMEFLANPPAPGTPEDARFGARLRQVLGRDLDEPRSRLSLHLALLALKHDHDGAAPRPAAGRHAGRRKTLPVSAPSTERR